MADNEKKQGQSFPSGGHEAHKGTASKEKGKTGNLQHANGALLSTGGGEPIKPGKKWTDERRVLQPRDPKTGTFTYNAEAKWGLKYKQRNKAHTVPPSARELVLATGINPVNGMIHKGDVIIWNGKTQIALKDMSVQELYAYFQKYDENSGEYYLGRAQKQRQIPSKNRKLSSNFVTKQGRHSKAENEGIANGDNPFEVVGHYDMSKLSNKTAAAIQAKYAEAAKGFIPSGWSVEDAIITEEKYKANKRWNASHPGSGFKPRPNTTGPSGVDYHPAYPEGYKPSFEADMKGVNPPSGLFNQGKVDPSKIDYDGSAVQRRFFKRLAKHMSENPEQFHIPENMRGKITGKYIAKKMKTSEKWQKKNYQWGF